jgi:hypothetical protein
VHQAGSVATVESDLRLAFLEPVHRRHGPPRPEGGTVFDHHSGTASERRLQMAAEVY